MIDADLMEEINAAVAQGRRSLEDSPAARAARAGRGARAGARSPREMIEG